MTESSELEQKISKNEEELQRVTNRRSGSWISLVISLALLVYAVVKINTSSTYLLISVLCLMYTALNVWRIFRFGQMKKQLENDLSGYRQELADLPAETGEG